MKPPAFQFYVRDWLTDTELSRCSPATRGIWIDLLAAMWVAPDRGKLTKLTFDELARTARCTAAEAETAIDELERTGTASVTRYKSVTAMLSKVTVECRRMVRDENERNSNAERQKRYRENKNYPAAAKSNAKVTPPLASASASASASTQKEEEEYSASAALGSPPVENGESKAIVSPSVDLAVTWYELLKLEHTKQSEEKDQADFEDLLSVTYDIDAGKLPPSARKTLTTLAHQIGNRDPMPKSPLGMFLSEVGKMRRRQSRKN